MVDGWMIGWLDGWMVDGLVVGWLDGWAVGQLDGWWLDGWALGPHWLDSLALFSSLVLKISLAFLEPSGQTDPHWGPSALS